MKIAPHIDRFGDIRKMLVDYFQQVLLKKDNTLKEAFFKVAREKYGDPSVIKSESAFHEFTDNFVYSYKFPDNLTVIDRFVSETADLSEKEKAIVLRWKDPVVGLFQVKRTFLDGFVAENLINEVDYTIKPTTIPRSFERLARPGAFFRAKIIPIGNKEYIFSGIQELLDIQEKEILKIAASLQLEHPEFAFRDNEEKIQQGFEMQKKDRALFIEYFGSDEVLTEGKKLNELMAAFMDYKLKKHDKPIPEGYRPPKMKFPKDLVKSKDVGIVFDEVSGQHYLIDYGLILNIFQEPDESKIKRYNEEILTYLEDDTISPVVLRRVFFRFPQNAEFIVRRVLNRPEFDLKRDFDSLVDEFKPSFKGKKIFPQIMTMSERMTRILRPYIKEKRMDPRLEEMIPAPAEAERNIRNAVEGESCKNKRGALTDAV